jgi:hypothetical protein
MSKAGRHQYTWMRYYCKALLGCPGRLIHQRPLMDGLDRFTIRVTCLEILPAFGCILGSFSAAEHHPVENSHAMKWIPLAVISAALLQTFDARAEAAAPAPPPGFRAIFNGQDLTGWYGLNPHSVVKLQAAKREASLKAMRDEFAKHWSIENGELVNVGTGPYATTNEEFGDIELLIDYKTVPHADSGVYLRGSPQVQIWDVNQPSLSDKPDRNPNKGSGGLFNNTPKSPGRDPLVRADKPFGEWNAFRIRQIGDLTWVWLNDQLVVDGAVMENFWDRTQPLPVKGPVMLQTHGGEIRWRNIFVREIGSVEAKKILSEADAAKASPSK